MNKAVFVFIFLVCCSAVVIPAYARHADLKDTRAAIEKKQRENSEKSAKKSRAEKKMKSVQGELVKVAQQSQNIERKLNALEAEKNSLEKEQAYLAERLLEDQGLSTTLFRAIYQAAQLPPYGLYFSQTPKSEIINRMIVLKTTLPELYDRMSGFEAELDKIHALQKEIERNIARQAAAAKKLAASSEDLNRLVKKRKSLFRQASASYRQGLEEIEKLKKEAKTLEELVASLKPAPRPSGIERTAARPLSSGLKPPMAGDDKYMPVAGTIKIGFGETDEIGGESQGLIFTTRAQAVVVSPMEGKVVFAGPFQNFKRLLIIEHFGGYHSLVAGLDRIETQLGSSLKAGEPIGRIVRDNDRQGRLYYELRKNGKPVDPASVLAIKQG